MKNNRNVWVIVLIIAAFVWYASQSPAPATPADQGNQTESVTPTITGTAAPIIQIQSAEPVASKPAATVKSIAPASGFTPGYVVSGTASGVSSVSVTVRATPSTGTNGLAQLYTQTKVPVVDGRWSFSMRPSILTDYKAPYNVIVTTTGTKPLTLASKNFMELK